MKHYDIYHFDFLSSVLPQQAGSRNPAHTLQRIYCSPDRHHHRDQDQRERERERERGGGRERDCFFGRDSVHTVQSLYCCPGIRDNRDQDQRETGRIKIFTSTGIPFTLYKVCTVALTVVTIETRPRIVTEPVDGTDPRPTCHTAVGGVDPITPVAMY